MERVALQVGSNLSRVEVNLPPNFPFEKSNRELIDQPSQLLTQRFYLTLNWSRENEVSGVARGRKGSRWRSKQGEEARWEFEARKASASSFRALISSRLNLTLEIHRSIYCDLPEWCWLDMQDERRMMRTTTSKALSFMFSISCWFQPAFFLFESSIWLSRTLQTRFFSESEPFESPLTL